VSCDPVSSYRFALCFAVAKLISSSPMFKREAALWIPVVFIFKREAALWIPVVFIF